MLNIRCLHLLVLIVAIAGALANEGGLRANTETQAAAAKPTDEMNIPEKGAAEVQAADACSTGFVGLIAARAPGCFDPCKPAVCTAMGGAIRAYLHRRSKADVKQAVCADQAPFQCLLQPQNVGRCQPLFEKAKQLGVPLPESSAELSDQCSSHLAAAGAVSGVAVLPAAAPAEGMLAGMVAGMAEDEDTCKGTAASVAGTEDKCSTGLVGVISFFAPGCLDPCKPEVCTALGCAIKAYRQRRNYGDVKEAVCADQEPFHCLLEPQNVGRCEPLFVKAKQFGVSLPRNTEELTSLCNTSNPEDSAILLP